MLGHSVVNLICLLGFVALLAAAAVEDLRRLIIPNRLPLAIAGLFPAYALSAPAPVDWIGALAVAGPALAVGFVLFSLRYAGGGDVKLFAATTLWAGPHLFAKFVFVTAVAGAGLAVAMLTYRRLGRLVGTVPPAPVLEPGSPKPPPKPELPYGVAIGLGGLEVALMLLAGA